MKRITYIGLVLLVIFALLLIFWQSQTMKTSSVTTALATTSKVAISVTPVSSSMNAFTSTIAKSFSTPIVFYGRVVDESNKPIDGASVNYTASSLQSVFSERGDPKSYGTHTDVTGMFAISGIDGGELDISVTKDGYTELKKGTGSLSVAYGIAGPDTVAPSEDPANPHIFRLKANLSNEPKESDTVHGSIVFNSKLNAFDPLELQLGSVGVISFTYNSPPYEGDFVTPHDWILSITIKGGGIQEMNTPESQIAPANNYKDRGMIQMLKTDKKWDWRRDGYYYVKLYFSTLHVKSPDVTIEYTCNPKSGSLFLSLPSESQDPGN